MVVGNGDVASVLKDREDVIFLASGLSNSSNVTYRDLVREKQLIQKYSLNRIVYFSSLAIYYSDTDYTRYKLEIEQYIKDTCKQYCIIRLGNIDWGTNPHTLLNYLKAHPEAERRDEIRYIINKEEFLHWVNLIPNFNTEMNLTGKMVNVKDL